MSAAEKQLCVWSEEMEAAYDAALVTIGGLDAAKPKAVLAELEPQFPHLTIQNVKWHLAAHRRRVERHRIMAPQNILPPTKWGGRMEEAYEAEVARQGGLYAARPKALLDALQPEFPELTLQTIKWHLQGQRRREQRLAQRASAGQDGQQQEQSHGSASSGAAAAAASAGPHVGGSTGGGATTISCGATSRATPASVPQHQQHQQLRQQREAVPAAPLPQYPPPVQQGGQAAKADEAAALPASSWQHSGGASRGVPSAGAASDCRNTLQAPLSPLAQQVVQQQMQQQQAERHAPQQQAQQQAQQQDGKKRRQQAEPGADGAEAYRRLLAAVQVQAATNLSGSLQRDQVMADAGQAAAQRRVTPPPPQQQQLQHPLSQMLALTQAQAEAQQQWAAPRATWRAWQPYLLPVAERRLARARQVASTCRQVAMVVQQQAAHLAELVQSLEEHDVLSGPMGEALSSYVEAASLNGESDEALLPGVLSKLLAAVSGEGGGSVAAESGAAAGGDALPVPLHFQKQHRIIAALTASFPAGPDLPATAAGTAGGAGTLAAALPAMGSGPGVAAAAHNAATCTLPNCLRCKYEARLARQQQQQQQL